MPRLRDTPHRALCRLILRVAGWKLDGELPDLPLLVLIAAPHSSWWDGVWGLLMKVAIGADIRFMAKQELFRPPLAGVLRQLGGIAVDRGATTGVVGQMLAQFDHQPSLWLGIAPEGTRKPVQRWKSGFWRIAHGAGVPVLPIAFDYPSKSIVIGTPMPTSADLDADLARLRAFYAPFRGKHRKV
jgi:1-acyl-sn-glycerol-3-phosphate acyltransferase